jgi:hypothetical protein
MVPLPGIAPRSARYQQAALLLSYRGEEGMTNERMLNDEASWPPILHHRRESLRVELHHDLSAYEAGALLLSYGGVEIGCLGWSRTNTVRLNRAADYCYPTRQWKG